MTYEDATFLRLAHAPARAAVFDQVALAQVLDAAYDVNTMGVEGPFQPIFDEFRVGLAPPRLSALEGTWRPVGSPEPTEVRLQLAGLGQDGVRVDAFWRGAIVARFRLGGEPIVAVETADVAAGTIDAEILDELGALPTDPDALESERRGRLLQRIKDAAAQPDAFDEAFLDRWLDAVGAASLGELVERLAGTVEAGGVRVTFAPPGEVPTSPRPLPIAAVLLIRDGGFSVAQLLSESKEVRERLKPLGLEAAKEEGLRPRRPIVVAWVTPISIFDDEDWPGGEIGSAEQRRAARRDAAGSWLAAEGIGLIATSTQP